MLSDTRQTTDGDRQFDPSEYLWRAMRRHGMSAQELAHELGVHGQTIYNVTSGKRRISSKLAVKLALKFGEPVEFWLGELERASAPARRAPTETSASTGAETAFGSAAPLLERRIHALARKLASKFGEPVEFWLNELDLSESLPELPPEMPARAPARSVATPPRQDAAAGLLVDRQLHELLGRSGSGLSIQPFDPYKVEPASYDLTVGLLVTKGFQTLDKFGWWLINKYENDPSLMSDEECHEAKLLIEEYENDIAYTGGLRLGRGEAIGIVLREEVHFGREFLARVGGTTRNALSGLVIGHGLQIDPGYHGPIIVTAMNLGLHDIDLTTGQKMLSLEILRLDQLPETPYHQGTNSRIARIVERLGTEIADLFDYEEIVSEARIIATPRGNPNEAFISDGKIEEARRMAVVRLVDVAARGDEMSWCLLPFTRALGHVTVDRGDAEALIRRFPACPSDAQWGALESFKDDHDRITLKNLFKRLELDPGPAVARLIRTLA